MIDLLVLGEGLEDIGLHYGARPEDLPVVAALLLLSLVVLYACGGCTNGLKHLDLHLATDSVPRLLVLMLKKAIILEKEPDQLYVCCRIIEFEVQSCVCQVVARLIDVSCVRLEALVPRPQRCTW